jgi:hypothetical protein
MTIFSVAPSLVALNNCDAIKQVERATALAELLESGSIEAVYRDGVYCGFLDRTPRLPMLAPASA